MPTEQEEATYRAIKRVEVEKAAAERHRNNLLIGWTLIFAVFCLLVYKCEDMVLTTRWVFADDEGRAHIEIEKQRRVREDLGL